MENVDWEDLNRKNWDERAPLHAASPDYNLAAFIADPSYISPVVAFDAPLLGSLAGLRCAHLQCHIGTDTLSLARLGASSVVGLDFSSASLAEARRLSTSASGGDRLTFVEASVYDALKVLPPASFDLVFTGVGALCWIPDIRGWAAVVAGLLAPGGGRLFLREGHPMLWALDDAADREELVVKNPYFERKGRPLLFDEGVTYVEHEPHEFQHTVTAEFSHGLGEIVQALLDAGLRVTGLAEHQSVPWDALPGQMEDIGGGEYALKTERWRLPLSYTLQAIKD
ncbi:Methyltransferase type 12 [Cordyceps fumosorosea ARSEF 2679]|uniref:Methyltransferase type 12 n=1 Tax=Cordyceps fumosorosea (strain ARSEF 2679) TaxID=1081104 RepID=A0A168DBR0_CORFA|nr:Methyltransferase type 12 [Cordyceps fumosorosea ARSEF 2679]OAA72410.1 Methyltransferase type 12 [Cordyceps fumosorosea ARSEF 2679]